MTLILLVRTETAIHVSADFRLTTFAPPHVALSDAAAKFVVVSDLEWHAMIAYTGVGAVAGTSTSDWAAQVLTDNWTRIGGIQDVANLLRDEASPWLERVPFEHRGHCFVVAGYEDAVQHTYLVSNLPLDSDATLQVSALGDRRQVALGVEVALREADRRHLKRLARSRVEPAEIRKALAGINSRVALNPASGGLVSRPCYCHSMARGGDGGEPHGVIPGDFVPRFIIGGMDIAATLNLQRASPDTPVQMRGMQGARQEEPSHALFSRLLEEDPDDAKTHGDYAVFLEREGSMERAEEHFRLAMRAPTQEQSSLNNYANFLRNVRRDVDGAERQYRSALALNREAIALSNLASLLFTERGEVDEARALYIEAVEKTPWLPLAQIGYAKLLIEADDDVPTAQAHVRLGLEREPGNVLGLAVACEIAHRSQDVAPVEDLLWSGAEVTDSPPALSMVGMTLVLVGRGAPATALVKRAADAAPDDPALVGHHAFAVSLTSTGDVEAERLYHQALQNPDCPPAVVCNYVQFLCRRGRLDEADRLLVQLESADLGEPASSVEAAFYRLVYWPDRRATYTPVLLQLLEGGARSPLWDLATDVAQLPATDPYRDLLHAVAGVVAGKETFAADLRARLAERIAAGS